MKGLHQEKSFENLKQLFAKKCTYEILGLFQRQASFDDEHRCGAVTAVTVTNIDAAGKK